jgi:hypothetical protein
MSGLHKHSQEWLRTHRHPNKAHRNDNILVNQPLQLSIIYLGLPLTHKKPTKGLFNPLFSMLQCRLQRLTGIPLSIVGRTVLLKLYPQHQCTTYGGSFERVMNYLRRALSNY